METSGWGPGGDAGCADEARAASRRGHLLPQGDGRVSAARVVLPGSTWEEERPHGSDGKPRLRPSCRRLMPRRCRRPSPEPAWTCGRSWARWLRHFGRRPCRGRPPERRGRRRPSCSMYRRWRRYGLLAEQAERRLREAEIQAQAEGSTSVDRCPHCAAEGRARGAWLLGSWLFEATARKVEGWRPRRPLPLSGCGEGRRHTMETERGGSHLDDVGGAAQAGG